MTIPFSEGDERGALSCVLLAGSESQPEVDELLGQLKPSLFWDSRHQVILDAMRSLRHQRHAVDLVTVSRTLMGRNGEATGALALLPELMNVAPSWSHFPSYLEELQRQALRRWTLEKRERLTNLAMAPNLSLDTLRDEFGDLAEKADRIGRPRRSQIQAVSDQELASYTPAESLGLVGDTDVQKGYQGITVIAGPPGSGKSLVAVSLAIAGAIGGASGRAGRSTGSFGRSSCNARTAPCDSSGRWRPAPETIPTWTLGTGSAPPFLPREACRFIGRNSDGSCPSWSRNGSRT